MSKKRSAARGFAPRPLVQINSSMAGGELPVITREKSLDNLTDAALAKSKKANTKESTEAEPPAPPEPEPVATEPADEAPAEPETHRIEISQEQIETLARVAAEQAVAKERERLEAQHAAEKESLEAELQSARDAAEQAEQAKQKAEKDKEVLSSVFKQLGHTEPTTATEAKAKEMSAPNINRYTAPDSDEPFGTVKEAIAILDESPATAKTMTGGGQYIYADQTELNRYVKNNRDQLVLDLEKWAKKNGLLRGRNAVSTYGQVKAATTIGDLPGGFLDVLSAVMRTNNRGRFVMWQFPITVHQFDMGMGNQAEIPRSPYIPAPTTSDQRKLSGGGVYRTIDPGNQNIQTGVELATLMEYGLGGSSDAPPVMIPTFINSYSMIDLMAILQRNLLRDYYNTEEVAIREKYKLTNAIVYNSSGAVTSTPTVGSLSSTYLNNLFAYLQELQVPTYDNGCYVTVQPSAVVAAFKNSLQTSGATLWQAPNTNDLMALTNILNPTTIGTGEVDRVTGYVGTYGNFMIFDTNTYGVGSPTVGGVNGVQTETIGSAVTTRSGFAFGADAVGRAIGTEFQIVQDEKTDFGRSNRFIWRSEEAFHALDVAPQAGDTRPVPQQLRVLETRLVA